ncbi:MAG: hypothetical protein GEU95_22465 [Rhizobiales bacterium]|nr:hypothetical protein [Hyphomicrobiales bacterium]
MPLGLGSIAFVGFNADGNDNLAFVVLEDIAAGTVINFTDNEWIGSSFTDDENHWSWTATGDIGAGAVVTMDDLATTSPTSNLGTIEYSTDAARDIGNTQTANEAVYAYVGDAVSPTFLAAISNSNFFDGSGSFNPNIGVLEGTGLTGGLTAVGLPGHILAYDGRHVTGTTFEELLPIINDRANWISQGSGNDESGDGIAPDVPFSTDPFILDPTAQEVNFATDSLSVQAAEGDSGTRTITFVVERTNGTVGDLNFSGTVTLDNVDAEDFGGTPPLTFAGTIPAGETSATVSITISGDTEDEQHESFSLTLTSVSNPDSPNSYLGENVVADALIENDDFPRSSTPAKPIPRRSI